MAVLVDVHAVPGPVQMRPGYAGRVAGSLLRCLVEQAMWPHRANVAPPGGETEPCMRQCWRDTGVVVNVRSARCTA